jgi:hypothetical protein
LDRETALRLREDIFLDSRPPSFGWMQCKGCRTFTKGDPTERCIFAKPDYTGCNLVNHRAGFWGFNRLHLS